MRGGELTFEASKDGQGEEEALDKSVYNWSKIIGLTLVSALSGFCFGYDTAVISGATLYLVNDFPDITKE